MGSIKNEGYIKYLISKTILQQLLSENLITEKELLVIDMENKKAFESLNNQRFDLIS